MVVDKAFTRACEELGVSEELSSELKVVSIQTIVMYTYLHTLLGDSAKEWMSAGNKAFGGKSAVELLEEDYVNIAKINRYLGASIHG